VAGDVIEAAPPWYAIVDRVVARDYLADVHALEIEGLESYLVASKRLVVIPSISHV
jgi:hypothetical protein